MILPSLAEKIGLNESLMLQALYNYWGSEENDENERSYGVVCYDFRELIEDVFTFWDINTIRKTFDNLKIFSFYGLIKNLDIQNILYANLI